MLDLRNKMMVADHNAGAVCDISYAEKVRIYSYEYLKCCKFIIKLDEESYFFTKRLYAKLSSSSHLLEDFLDFHGAKNNTNWFLYRELAATVRHVSLAAYAQQHIHNRQIFYGLGDTGEFMEEGRKTLLFFRQVILRLAPIILDEAARLGIPLPEKNFDDYNFAGVLTGEMLPHDIDDEETEQQQEYIVKIASEFLGLARALDNLSFFSPYSYEEILDLVPATVNEVEIRHYEMLVHNLQSSFDSYVIHGGLRYGNRKLKSLRGHFSVVFHLFQIIGRLLHYYERHLHGRALKHVYNQVRERLAELVNPQQLLDRTINYGLYYACHFLSNGQELAREILNENIARTSITVGIPQKLGFHSRPSLLVAKIVQHFGGQVELCVGDCRFDASSVLDIQWAGGKIQKEKIQQVIFEGDERALRDIEILSRVNYGEDTIGKGVPLPKELNYLR